ncbi:MAG: isopentenyl phosphate kinase [Halapricum sp.]
MTTVLKLGGSVVTDKDDPETIDRVALDATVAAIAESGVSDLVVVHGGGSFGHHNAAEHGVTDVEGTHDAAGVLAIHDAMRELNAAVVEALQERDVPALPVHPLSTAHRDTDGKTTFPSGQVEAMLGEGFVPVTHGDVVVQAGEGATVLSGDEIVTRLAGQLSADRVGLCTTVPGVLDGDDEVIDRIGDFESVAEALGASDATDVTGGMAGKVRALLALDTPATIFGPDDLTAFLEGDRPGTLVQRAEK